MRHAPWGTFLRVVPLLAFGCGVRPIPPPITAGGTPPVSDEAWVTSEHDWTTPSVRHGTWTVTGRLSAAQVVPIVRQNTGRFRLCFDEALRRRPELEGGIDVVFHVDAKGHVTDAREVSSTVRDATLVACVLGAFTPMVFPPAEARAEDGDVEVRGALAFEPGRRVVRTPASER